MISGIKKPGADTMLCDKYGYWPVLTNYSQSILIEILPEKKVVD